MARLVKGEVSEGLTRESLGGTNEREKEYDGSCKQFGMAQIVSMTGDHD